MKFSVSDDIKHIVRKLEGLLEIAILCVIYFYVWKFCYRNLGNHFLYGKGKFVLAGVYFVIALIIFSLCESLEFGHFKIVDIIASQFIAEALLNFVTYIQLSLMYNKMINIVPLMCMTVLDYMLSAVLCYFFTSSYHKSHMPRKMILVYENDKAVGLMDKMNTRADKYRVITAVKSSEGLNKVIEKIEGHDAVVINDVPAIIRNDIVKYCYKNEIRTYEVPKISDIITRGADEVTLFDTPLLLVKGSGLTIEQRAIKRFFDILLCLLIMIPGSLIMLITAMAIKFEDQGPIFYTQTRVTRGGKKFDILKFRSMIVDAEKDGMSIPAVDKDPRITRVGNIIRPMRIDELPQLLNILRGDMSFVGPRPERVEHVEKYTEQIPEFVLRSKVKGGLTGYAQIYGKYNTSAYDKLRLDLAYIENYSLLLDIKIVFRTLQILFKKESTEGFEKKSETGE